jgi:hypothetical protein
LQWNKIKDDQQPAHGLGPVLLLLPALKGKANKYTTQVILWSNLTAKLLQLATDRVQTRVKNHIVSIFKPSIIYNLIQGLDPHDWR